jgi:hypothetical protein
MVRTLPQYSNETNACITELRAYKQINYVGKRWELNLQPLEQQASLQSNQQ